jgi:ferredoxin-NADP reductase
MNAPLPKTVADPVTSFNVLVKSIRLEAQGICAFELVDPDGNALPEFEPGSHVDVHLPGGVVRSYSLAGNPDDSTKWILGVLKEPKSRGGSLAMHEKVRVGDVITVGPVRNAFPMHEDAKHSILIGGGIGITPLKSMAHKLSSQGKSFELHYCAKTIKNAAFVDELEAIVPVGSLHFHFDEGDPAKGLDIKSLLNNQPEGTHVYFCGPGGFMKACEASASHWTKGTVHCEHFKAPESAPSTIPDGAFEVRLIRSGQTIQVGPDQTIVRAIELTGLRVPTSCLSGLCGACKVDYVDGEVDHRDYILTDEERSKCLTVCVSRAKSKTLSLDI